MAVRGVMFGIAPRRTRAQRERDVAARLGLVRLIALGWADGPLLVMAASEARRGEAVRKERRRVEQMALRIGPAVLLEFSVVDGARVEVLRREVRRRLAGDVVSGEMYGVDSASLERAIRGVAASLGVRLMGDAELADMVAREMEKV